MVHRGVPQDLADQMTAAAPPDHETALELVRSRFPVASASHTGMPPSERRALLVRVSRFLAARGYGQDTIEEVVRKVTDGFDESP